jgi:hypothetical protein
VLLGDDVVLLVGALLGTEPGAWPYR